MWLGQGARRSHPAVVQSRDGGVSVARRVALGLGVHRPGGQRRSRGTGVRRLTGDSQLRWLGPEKGVIHLATGAIVNAVWDLWAKLEGTVRATGPRIVIN